MNKFSNSVQKLLHDSGWIENRQIDINPMREALLNTGYKWFPSIENFLKEFGNLCIRFVKKSGKSDSFHFDALKADNEVDSSWILLNYSKRIGREDACVIGQGFSDHLTLFMDDLGRVFGGYDDSLFLIGDTGEEAVERICRNEEFKELE